jgi:hypothetical protein
MLYSIAHFLRDKCPIIWDFIDWVNSVLFSLRYGNKLMLIDGILSKYNDIYKIEGIKEKHLNDLVDFFIKQPEEAFKYFKPHGFDYKTLRKLQKNKAFLSYIVLKDDEIVGYFFLRSYFFGKCFRGYMVDANWRNRGISKLTAKVMTDIAILLNIPSFGTISPNNMPSMKSQNAINNINIIKQLANGDYYVEYIPREKGS